ncbi:MAG: hypothetical protein ACI93T_002155 [Porticoccaceae bacterium]|jgi:hypothetical protein
MLSLVLGIGFLLRGKQPSTRSGETAERGWRQRSLMSRASLTIIPISKSKGSLSTTQGFKALPTVPFP